MKPGAPFDTAYWRRIDALLEAALELPPAARPAWLDALGEEDKALRPALESMLAREEGGSGFMGSAVDLAALDAQLGDKPGDIVGPYRLLDSHGEGGMGTVWRAERADGTLQRSVALKLPRTGWSPALAERLAREIAILATLEHPNIARLYDAGVAEGGRPYLAMESIDGVRIDQYCRDKGLGVADRLRLFLQVARAVTYAHARLVVHRDLKPANILVDGQGAVHVVDFGIAKLLDSAPEAAAAAATRTMGRAFTPEYASPEHVRGDLITVASDVYSLGVLLYELLTEKRPYRLKRSTAAELEEAITTLDVPAPSSQVAGNRGLARSLRGDLDTIVGRALRKEPAERYPTVDAMAADIERHLRGEPVLARPDSLAYRAGKFVRRHRVGVAFAGVLFAVGTAGVAGVVYQSHLARLERDRALRELRYAEAAEEFTRFLLGEQTGRPVAPQELLARAREAVSGQFANDPTLRARMQLVLAELYGELNEFKQGEALLREARASAIAANDVSARAQAECALGSMLGTTGREAESAALFAANMPAVDARAAVDPRAYQVCHAWRGNYLRNRGLPGAGPDFEAALRSMEANSTGHPTTARIRLKASIADSYGASGRLPEALRLYDEATSELARIGRVNTSYGWTLANNHIFNLVRAGRLKQVEEVYVRATGSPGRDRVPSADLAIAYGRVLVDFGRLDEAERLLVAAADEKARIGHRRGEAYALLGVARSKCARGDEAACDAAIAAARARFEAFEPPGHSVYATFEYLRGVALMEKGRAARARAHLEEAVRLFGAARNADPLRVRALSLLALSLEAAGEHPRARESAARAVAMAREMTQEVGETEWVGSALIAQASIHERQRDPEGARDMAADARRHLEATLGMDAPVMARWLPMMKRLGA